MKFAMQSIGFNPNAIYIAHFIGVCKTFCIYISKYNKNS